MTESDTFSDDELARLLAAEQPKAALEDRKRAEKAVFMTDFYSYLEDRHVLHASHPDPAKAQELEEHLVAFLVGHEAADEMRARGTVTALRIREEAAVDIIAELHCHVKFGAEQTKITARKKQLEARLLIAKFPQGWLDALHDYIPGEALDLGNEQDFLLYTHLAMARLNPRRHPLAVHITNIVFGEADTSENNSFTPENIRRIEISSHIMGVIIRASENGDVPTAKAKIDALVRSGDITAGQAAAIHETIDNPPADEEPAAQ